MPLYSYYCEKCNQTYEKLESANSPKEINCERCNGIAKRELGRIVAKESSKGKQIPELFNVRSI
ncbi:MAG TPA: zinc ribbon domain-containing protein [Candidatus Paceibacterota bacterium]|nr:zinc ribbon domain-containing protein [Candidatus Paceibacterota bacterium]